MRQRHRFFYHYHKANKCMSVHYKGACLSVENVECMVPCNTKWNTIQPHLVMQGWASSVEVNNKTAIIK